VILTVGEPARPITSVRNARVAAARRLHQRTQRRESGLFLAEGPQAATEAVRAGRVTELFVTGPAAERHPELLVSDVPVRRVDATVLAALAETRSPQGIVAVTRIVTATLDAVVAAAPRLVVVLVDVADPGNVGTIVRTADAVGADAVVLAGASADAWGGKTVRASAGSVLHLPIVTGRSADGAVRALRSAGLCIAATDVRADTPLGSADLTEPTAWLFGNEARGLSRELVTSAEIAVRVPIFGRAESLSVATAAAVCLYASARAHRR
jgi:TrmH family RNA methyltransferase